MFFPRSPSNVAGKKIQFGISGTRSEIEIFRLYPSFAYRTNTIYVYTFDRLNNTSFYFFIHSLRSGSTNSYPTIYWNRRNQRIYEKWFNNSIKNFRKLRKKNACYNFSISCGRFTSTTRNSSSVRSEWVIDNNNKKKTKSFLSLIIIAC